MGAHVSPSALAPRRSRMRCCLRPLQVASGTGPGENEAAARGTGQAALRDPELGSCRFRGDLGPLGLLAEAGPGPRREERRKVLTAHPCNFSVTLSPLLDEAVRMHGAETIG